MDDNSVVIGACGVVIALVVRRIRSTRSRTVWVRGWVKNRQQHGAYHQLVRELELGDSASYRNFLRMDVSTFKDLLRLVAPFITYQDANMREAIPAAERLAITLRFLATGEYKAVIILWLFVHTNYITPCRRVFHKFAILISNSKTNNWNYCSASMFCFD